MAGLEQTLCNGSFQQTLALNIGWSRLQPRSKHWTAVAIMAMAVLAADVWAQCDREECQKWRRLPPGTVIDEESKWCCRLWQSHPPPPPAIV